MRPHLACDLIADPIDAMIAGGLTDTDEMVEQGVACATNFSFGTEPTPEGKKVAIGRMTAIGERDESNIF